LCQIYELTGLKTFFLKMDFHIIPISYGLVFQAVSFLRHPIISLLHSYFFLPCRPNNPPITPIYLYLALFYPQCEQNTDINLTVSIPMCLKIRYQDYIIQTHFIYFSCYVYVGDMFQPRLGHHQALI